MNGSDNLRGETLGERYRISRRIGTGQSGTTYRGLDHSLRRQVAIKALHPALCQVPEQVKRFQREFEATRNLEHPNVVQTHELVTHRGRWFIVMELLEGKLLSDRLQQHPLPDLVESLEIARDVAKGLAAAHERRIIHRDLNPGNVMLLRDGRAKVLGFGVSRLTEVSNDELTAVGVRLGNAQYMAPEYIQNESIDHRVDLYALGCLLHLLLTGATPFVGPSLKVMDSHVSRPATPPSQKAAGIPPFVDELTLSLLAKDPNQRPDDAGVVAERLEGHLVEVQESEHWGPLDLASSSGQPISTVQGPSGFGSGAFTKPVRTPPADEGAPNQEGPVVFVPEGPSASRGRALALVALAAAGVLLLLAVLFGAGLLTWLV